MPEARLSPRERLVLTAIIELYIATGEPVASQAVAHFFADREGLSSATLRNVMATLGEAGLLEQPHTSAGRVPTAVAFRYYVEQITQPGRTQAGLGGGIGPGRVETPMSEARRGQIEESFAGVSSSNDYLERTSHVLALISSGLGVALASSTAGQVLEHIHFSRLSTGRVLAVLVTQAGAVQDRVLAVDHEMTQVELATAGTYLNESFRGWQIERIRAEVARRVEMEREAYRELLTSVEELCRKGALAGDDGGADDFCGRDCEPDQRRTGPRAAAADAAGSGGETAAGRAAECLCGRPPAGGARGGGPGRSIARHAGSGADWSAGAARRWQSGHGGRDCAHADSVSGDDPGGELHRAPLGENSGRAYHVGAGVMAAVRPQFRQAGAQHFSSFAAGTEGLQPDGKSIIQ